MNTFEKKATFKSLKTKFFLEKETNNFLQVYVIIFLFC